MNRDLRYLALALTVVAAAVVVASLRRDLLPPMLYVAVFGGLWGPFTEYWFFKDYWRPTGVLGRPVLEDILFGAGLSAFSAGVYLATTRRKLSRGDIRMRRLVIVPGFVVVWVTAMWLLQSNIGINSIFVSMFVYVAVTGFIVTLRRDLIVPAVASAAMVGAFALAGYAIGLDLVIDGKSFLREIWLLYGQPQGITLLGNVPLTEVLWYASIASTMSVLYEYITGATITSVGVTSGIESAI